MKIHQVTVKKYYKTPLNNYNSSNVITQNYNNYSSLNNEYDCSFKGWISFGQKVKQSVQKTWNNAVNGLSNAKSSIHRTMIEPIYNKFFNRTTKSIKPEKIQKTVVPAIKKTTGSIMPEPNFSMDYEKVLTDLKTIKNVDANWVKSNKPVLKAAFGYEDANMKEEFFKIQASEINRDRNGYIQDVINLRTGRIFVRKSTI